MSIINLWTSKYKYRLETLKRRWWWWWCTTSERKQASIAVQYDIPSFLLGEARAEPKQDTIRIIMINMYWFLITEEIKQSRKQARPSWSRPCESASDTLSSNAAILSFKCSWSLSLDSERSLSTVSDKRLLCSSFIFSRWRAFNRNHNTQTSLTGLLKQDNCARLISLYDEFNSSRNKGAFICSVKATTKKNNKRQK